MVCYVSFKPVRDFHRKPGGANEAVIRMLISIGRLVVKIRNGELAHENPARKTSPPSLKQ